MTREEAIKLIDTHTVCFYNEIDSPTLQALHMAIEALQEPKTIVGIDIPYGSDKGIATIFKGNEKMVLEEVKEIMSVVRCKDCKWKTMYYKDNESFYCDKTGIINMHIEDGDDEFWCKYGERKEE